MCTVSLIPIAAPSHRVPAPFVRLACNRDESHLRPPATPPQHRCFGRRHALLPVDPVSDGTWVAASDAGLALTLMNTYPVPFDRTAFLANAGRYRSRGAIIPSLLDCDTLEQAVTRAAELDPAAYPDFRLLLLDRHRFAELSATAHRLTVTEPAPISRPIMYASSGLGDALVTRPRRDLFDDLVRQAADPVAAQDRFHRHRWPDRPHLSVCMHRPEARTVSLTVVELHPDRVRLLYLPESPDRPVQPIAAQLPIRA